MLRALFGIAMGGEWGVGASLTMETIPPDARGFVSGLLQSGYPTGYLLASIVYGLLFPAYRLARHVHGRHHAGAARVLYPPHVPESPALRAHRPRAATGTLSTAASGTGGLASTPSC